MCVQILGCKGTLSGQCMVVDFAKLAEEEDQGAALQALVAPQLKDSPSSLFFIANIDHLEPSGAAVLLALIGMLQFSVFMLSISILPDPRYSFLGATLYIGPRWCMQASGEQNSRKSCV